MRILIMSVTAGGGHNATAQSMKNYLESKNIECKVIDTMNYISKALAKTISEGYLMVTKDAKYAYASVYRMIEKRHSNANKQSIARIANSLVSSKLKKVIDDYAPDVIIYTHIFVGEILDILRVKGELSPKTIGILTDFVFHPFWEECLHLDYIVTANEMLDYQAQKKGFKKEQVVPLGIPINPKFATSKTKEEARAELGLNINTKTVLLMGGSMGYGNIKKTVIRLDNIDVDFQLIVVCGNNKKMYEEVNSLSTKKRVLALGYVNNVELLMDASDCIISKPGGLTTSEALAKRLPMIIVNPIPGQEERNTEFLLNNGACMAVSPTFTIEEAVYAMFSHPDKIGSIIKNIDILRKPNATADVCEFAIKAGEDYIKSKTEK